jgi:phage terminase large subunit-like protein
MRSPDRELVLAQKRSKTNLPSSRRASKRSAIAKPAQPRSRTEAPAFTHAAIANQYARDVSSGRISVCKWVKLSCQRHLDDLARAKDGWNYVFDEAKANNVCEFIEALPHTKGDWAARGERLVLGPWQIFIVCVLFGWLKRESRTRRFSIAYITVPRKNGKSALAAAIGMYMFCADGEFAAEVYSGATSEKQAWEVFRPARDMAARTPDLAAAFGITVGKQTLFIQSNGSRFEPVIGRPGDGASVHCGIVDEYHEHDTDDLYDTLRTGMAARRQPLMLVITTAGDNMAGPCKLLEGDVQKVLDGSDEREELFGIIYTIDQTDLWTSEEALLKCNPNYGVSVFGDFLKTEQNNAITNPRKQGIFKTKHENVWVGAVNAYFNVQLWNELADPSLNPDEFRGLVCVASVDLSTKKDIAARVIVFKKQIDTKDHYYVFGRFYLPEKRAMLPEFQHFQGWAATGKLRVTPGERIDYGIIERETVEDVRRFLVRELCYDPWNAEKFAQDVEKQTRAKAIEIPQTAHFLSDPMKQLEAAIAERRIHHEGNPAFAWAIGNVVAKEDAKGEVFPRKERADNLIDPAVCLITAFRRALVIPSKPPGSIYSSRGIRGL